MLKNIFGKAKSLPSEFSSLASTSGKAPNINFWHEYNASDTIFIFVHGFFSNGRKCWTSKADVYWPDLVVSDARFGSPSIYMAGYFTEVDSGSYEIADCAKEVFDAITRPSVNGDVAPITKSNIIFICHSLGGIVTRYLIEHYRELFIDKAVGLVLLASPSFGSDYATNFNFFARLYNNGIADQLQSASSSLRDLDSRFKSLIENKLISKFIGAEAIEHHHPWHCKWIPGLQPVVEKESAARYFGESRILANTNHSTSVKPESHDHVAHQFLVSTYINKFLPIKIDAGSVSKIHDSKSILPIKQNVEASALFEIYDPSFEPYYLHRRIDNDLSSSLSLFSLWIYGESGVGKTSAVRREIFSVSSLAIQAYIGAAVNESGGHEELLKEIYYTVTGKLGATHKDLHNAHQVITELSELLSVYSKCSSVFLVLDEVPLLETQPEEMKKFIAAICNLIVLIKQKTGRADLRLTVTSIFDPSIYIPPDRQKINEQIRFMRFDRWTDDEMRELVHCIQEALPSLSLENNDIDEVIISASGSPRFIKTFYKNYKLAHNGQNNSVTNAIRQTKLTLGTQAGITVCAKSKEQENHVS